MLSVLYAIARPSVCLSVCLSHGCIIEQESHAVAGKPRDAAVNSDRYRVCWHFAGAISVSRMQPVSGCTVYA